MTLPARSMNYDPLEAAEGDGPDDGRAPPYDTLSRAYPGLHPYLRWNLSEYLGDLGPCDVVGSSLGKSNLRADASAQKWVVAAHGETGPGCGVTVLMRCGNPGCRHEWMGDQTCKDRRCP